ncbi:hypothetical protein Taro_051538 [Colocasia esculenta]|uniref:CASP-like protein n=1 Tax=Colocasia esculenta TaxID=4460 RepID=A0A843XG93_COLES|nr:hypothetical protein [Colocasia esculenta]
MALQPINEEVWVEGVLASPWVSGVVFGYQQLFLFLGLCHPQLVLCLGSCLQGEEGCSEEMSSGVGVSPGNVPVFYGGGRLKVVDRRVKVAEVVLRCLICGLGVAVATLVGTDKQVKRFFAFEKKAKFTEMKALVFLVVANAIAAGYSLVQGLRCIVSMIRGSVLFNKPLAWAIFSCDQVLAYVMMAAVAASVQSAVFSELGQPELQWMKVCNMYRKFCTQIGEGIATATVASLSMVALSCMSAFNLFRLYGKNKGKGQPW